ncbi:MAG: Imm5 family immunity protein, partial [Dehalococcoidales bacterium]|nr:Imm5 family immunity protein [Dehalococcoidales bacterium]
REMAKALGGVAHYGKDTPIPLDKILEVCGLDDTLWALRIVIEPADREIRLFACDCAERVLPVFEQQYPDEKRPRQAIEIARKFANGTAAAVELRAAASATASATASAASAARDAAWAAAWAAWDAAWDAARAAARDAASATASAAARDARDAASAAAWDAASAAERDWQKARLIELLNSK